MSSKAKRASRIKHRDASKPLPTHAKRVVRERPTSPVLIDTSALIWWVSDAPQLSRKARVVLTDPTQSVLVSAVSFWEIGSKARSGRLVLPSSFSDFVDLVSSIDRVTILSADLAEWLEAADLVWDHRDPADRLIVATARLRDIPLISSDRAIQKSYRLTIW
ncbi:MAG: PIN domain nuclease [Gemmatimonas sp.]|nr:PIN domain nuclease [Gemmatimonas sp.]